MSDRNEPDGFPGVRKPFIVPIKPSQMYEIPQWWRLRIMEREAEIERLQTDAIDNEGVMVSLREGYLDAKKLIGEWEERYDQAERILHAIREAVGLEPDDGVSLLRFIRKRWITGEQLREAVEYAEHQLKHGSGSGWYMLNKLGIERCPDEPNGCGGTGLSLGDTCPGCDGIGAVVKKTGEENDQD